MTTDTPTPEAGMPEAFNQWAKEYIQSQYPFYNAEGCANICGSLKKQLYEAWKAGRADLKPTKPLAEGDCRQAFEDWYAQPECPSIERSGDGYRLMQAHHAWTTWQAAWNNRRAP